MGSIVDYIQSMILRLSRSVVGVHIFTLTVLAMYLCNMSEVYITYKW